MAPFVQSVQRFRLLVLAAAFLVLGLGVLTLRETPVDVLPEFTPPYAEIQTEALGLSADEVEQLITVPLEADLLNGVEGLEVIRSESVPGLSSIVLVFTPGSDVYRARQLVEERLTQAHALPNVSKPPMLLSPQSSSNRVLMVALDSDKVSDIEQSVIARWTVRPRLMGVPGVANVAVWGMRDQQLQVRVDPERLARQGITVNQVIRSAGNAQVVSPLTFLEASTPGTGGFVETPQQRLQVRHLLESLADPRELGQVPVEGTGGRLRLADVADVVVDHQPLIGDAVVKGGPGLMLVVEKLPGASTTQVTEGVEDALEDLRPGLSGITTDTSVFRPATYVEDALGNIRLALVAGAVLLLLGLLALRLHWRAVVVAVVTIPLSLVAAALVLGWLGHGLNALAFAGLAAAVGVVVDDAVVATDRVVRKLRQPGPDGSAAPVPMVVREASREMRGPVVYATLVVLLAILPVAVLGGRPGGFFRPLVVAYALAVTAALVVSLTVAPALASVAFARWRPAAEKPRAGRHGKRYVSALQRSAHGRGVVAGTVALGLLGLLALPFLGTSLVPTFQDRDLLVRLEAQPGTSNPRMTQLTTSVVERLEDVPGVSSVGAHVGRAVTGDRVTNVSSSDVWVHVDSDADYDRTVAGVEAAVREVPEARHEVVTYAAQRLRDVGALRSGGSQVGTTGLDVLTGADQPLAVRVFGQDPEVLRREAERVAQVVGDVDGAVDPRVVLPATQPTLEIEVDLERAQAFGISPGDVRRAEATLLQGIQVGSVFEQQKVFDVIVQGTPETRGSVEAVRALLIDRPGGGHVRLGQVADVRLVERAAVIERDAVSRRLDVTVGVSGRGVDAVAADIESRLATMSFPLEYHAEVQRESTGAEIGTARFLGFAAAAAVAAFLLLQAAFRSWRLAALVTALLPASLSGGLLVALVNGAELSLGALLGLLVLFGVAVRADLFLVCAVRAMERLTGRAATVAIVQRAARQRLAPTVTSAVGLGLLMVPFAVLGSRPGLEVVHPMALVVLGGLVTTTLMSGWVLPVLYQRLAPRLTWHDEETEERLPVGRDEPLVAAAHYPAQRRPSDATTQTGGEAVR